MTRQEVLAIVKAAVEAQDPHTATDVLYTAIGEERREAFLITLPYGPAWFDQGYRVGRFMSDAPAMSVLESLGQGDLVDFVKGLCEGLEVNHA